MVSVNADRKPMSMMLRLVIAVLVLILGSMLVGRLAESVEHEGVWTAITAAGGYLLALFAFWAMGRRDRASSRRLLRWWVLLPACMAAAFSLTVWLGIVLDRRDLDLPRIGYRPITAWENWRYVVAGVALLAGSIVGLLLHRMSKMSGAVRLT
jgi:hypothetical protein